MDAVKFLMAYGHMCQMQADCIGCPVNVEICAKSERSEEEAAELVEAVEMLEKERLGAAPGKEELDEKKFNLEIYLQMYVNALKRDHWRYRKKVTEAAAAKDGETERFYYGICTQIMMTVCELERWLEDDDGR